MFQQAKKPVAVQSKSAAGGSGSNGLRTQLKQMDYEAGREALRPSDPPVQRQEATAQIEDQRFYHDDISTAIPKEAKAGAGGAYQFTRSDISITVKPDKFSATDQLGRPLPQGRGATTCAIKPVGGGASFDSTGLITQVTPPKLQAEITTYYGIGTDTKKDSAYGAGARPEDRDAGGFFTTIKYHEGSHGDDFVDYMTENPPPPYPVTVGTHKDQYQGLVDAFDEAVMKYQDQISDYSLQKTDDGHEHGA